MRTLLVIPSYNEALNIENVIKDIQENAKGIDYVIVDDGSKDNTREIIEKNHFNCIYGFMNQGLFGAVQTGFKYALEYDYDIAIQFDGDGQHPASAVAKLVEAIEAGNDIAIGSRFVSEKKPFTARMLGNDKRSYQRFAGIWEKMYCRLCK